MISQDLGRLALRIKAPPCDQHWISLMEALGWTRYYHAADVLPVRFQSERGGKRTFSR